MIAFKGNRFVIDGLLSAPFTAADTVVLAGAGISLEQPSCFPAGQDIISILATWLGGGGRSQVGRGRNALSNIAAIHRRSRDDALWYTHRHPIEATEIYASVSLDYLDQAELQGDIALAGSIVSGLARL